MTPADANARAGTMTSLRVLDVRFPTSREHDGSDAMNVDPDYSAAYVIIGTDRGDGVEGHGLTFTIGRGNEVVVAGINALRPLASTSASRSATASCAGSVRRRGSCSWPRRRS